MSDTTTNQINTKAITHSEEVRVAASAIVPVFGELFVAPSPIWIVIAPGYGVYRLLKGALKR